MRVDFLTEAGSKVIARRIKQYWEAKGFKPPAVWLGDSIRSKEKGSTIACLRSDMVNGLPRRRQYETDV